MRSAVFLMAAMLLIGCSELDFDVEIEASDVDDLSSIRADGPFGMDMGMSRTELAPDAEEISFNVYKTYVSPRPNTLMDWFELSFASSGLCMVEGIGRDVDTSPDGSELNDEVLAFRDALVRIYGEPSYEENEGRQAEMPDADMDAQTEASETDNSLSMMEELSAGDRTWQSCWTDRETDYAHDVESLCLRAKAVQGDPTTGYVLLRYEFDNYAQCKAMAEDRALTDL